MIIQLDYKGGKGSGNWNHAGRPDKEGGSLPKGSGGGGGGAAAGNSSSQGPTSNTMGNMPKLSIPLGTVPEHVKGDYDGKKAYADWYASLDQKPNLAEALAMRRFFADRALDAEQALGEESARKRDEERKKKAEEAAKQPKYVDPKTKKKMEAAAKKAASAAAAAKKKADSEAAKKKKAEEAAAKKAAAGAGKAKTAEEKKAAAEAAKKAAAAAKAKAKQEEDRAKLDSQMKVAAAIGLNPDAFNMLQDAVNTLKGGGDLPANVSTALINAGLLIKSGNTVTVPAPTRSLISAIMSADALKAQDAMARLAKLNNSTKELGQVRLFKIDNHVVIGR